PQGVQIEREALTARDGIDDSPARLDRLRVLAGGAEGQDLERAALRVEQPVPAHAEARVVDRFVVPVAAAIPRRRRDDLDGDVGRAPDDAVPREWTPAGKVDGDVGLAAAPR